MKISNGSPISVTDFVATIVILALVAGPLLSAVEGSREQERRNTCAQNLSQLVKAFHEHHELQRGLPPARTTFPANHGWCVNLLPFVEQQSLYDRYHFDQNFYDRDNEPVVSTPLALLECPAAPEQHRVVKLGMGNQHYGTDGVASDYFVNHILNPMGRPEGQRRNPALHVQNQFQPLSAIVDGLAQTTLIHEQAGRPDFYVLGVKQPDNNDLVQPGWWSAWASYHHFQYQGYSADGKSSGWDCSINCNNGQGIFSFHPGGANAAFCDGSVRFLHESIPVELVFALGTRDGGEIVSDDDY